MIHVMDSKAPTSNGACSGTTRASSPSNGFSALMLPSANINFSVRYLATDGDDRAFSTHVSQVAVSLRQLCKTNHTPEINANIILSTRERRVEPHAKLPIDLRPLAQLRLSLLSKN